MAIAVGVHAKGVGTNVAVTTGVTTQATGSTFVAGIIFDPIAAFGTIVDSFLNTWVIVGSEQSNGAKMRVYRVENGAGGASHTVTVSMTSLISVFFLEITGAAAASVDATSIAQASDSSSPFTVTSGTLEQAAELVVAAIGSDSGSNPATLAESTGFIIQEKEENGAANWAGGIATKIVSATTALTPSFTQTGAGNTVLTIIGFKEAGGAASTAGVGKRMAGYRHVRMVV